LGSRSLGEAPEASCPLDSRPLGTKRRGLGLDQRPLGVPLINNSSESNRQLIIVFFSFSPNSELTTLKLRSKMFGLGFQEVLLILVIIFLLFGVKRLPEIGKGLGETMREIRNIRSERKAGKEKEEEKDKGRDKGKEQENKKGNFISEIKKEVEEIPGLKEAREIKEAADKVKGITKFFK